MARIVSQSAQEHFESRAGPAYSTFLRLKSRDNAVAAAVAFWEMRDHLRGDTGKAEFDQALFKSCPELELIRDIAEASKHADLCRDNVKVSGISGTGSIGGEATIISPLGSLQTVPPCTLQVDLKDGSSLTMEDFLVTAAKFLRAQIN